MTETAPLAKATTEIRVSASKVWEALTTPEIIKKYFFGSDIVTDWQEGHPIFYKGEWQGRAYEDKGVILKVEAREAAGSVALVTALWHRRPPRKLPHGDI